MYTRQTFGFLKPTRYLHSLLLQAALLLLLLPVSLHQLRAQDEADSLLNAFEKAGLHNKILSANRLLAYFYQEELTDSLVQLTQNSSVEDARREAYYWAGEWYYVTQQFGKGLPYAQRALPLIEKSNNNQQLANCHSLLSALYFGQGNYAQAIIHAKESYRLDKLYGTILDQSSSLNNLAAIYLASNHPQEAQMFGEEALKYALEAGDSTVIAIRFGINAEINTALGKYDRALTYAKRAYDLEKKLNNPKRLGIRLVQMAAPQLKLGQDSDAQESLEAAIPMLQAQQNFRSLGIAYNLMGALRYKQERKAESAEYYRQALAIFLQLGDVANESKSRMGLSEALTDSDPKGALHELRHYLHLKDSLYKRENEQNLAMYNAAYQNDRLRLQNIRERERKNYVLWISITLIILALSFVGLLAIKNRNKSRQERLQRELSAGKNRFFSQITHEFRTPLTIIISASNHLRKLHPDDPELDQDVSGIERNSRNLLQLVNQILDVAKMTDLKQAPKEVRYGDLVLFCAMICDGFSTSVRQRQINFRYTHAPEEILTEFVPDYVLKILQNLLSNALKFTPKGKDVVCSLRSDGQTVTLQVQDQGVGMEPEELPYVFNPFYRTPGAEKRSEGSGIGLSLVKLLSEALGGSVSVQSTPGMGSTFTVTFPVRARSNDTPLLDYSARAAISKEVSVKPVEGPEEVHTEAHTEGGSLRILIVEDVPEVRRYIAADLEGDYDFYFAEDGSEGWAKAQDLVPDIIITDLMMPGIDGFELTRRVRLSALLCHIPIVMLTAKSTTEDRVRGIRLGADAYIEKPFRRDELNAQVQRLIEQRNRLQKRFTIEAPAAPNPAPAQTDAEQEELIKAEFMNKFRKIITERVREGQHIDLSQVADELFVTRIQLNRKIKAVSGKTSSALVAEIRIGLAQEILLAEPDLTIGEVAYRTGFDEPSYFSAYFKRKTGQSPGEYRLNPHPKEEETDPEADNL